MPHAHAQQTSKHPLPLIHFSDHGDNQQSLYWNVQRRRAISLSVGTQGCGNPGSNVNPLTAESAVQAFRYPLERKESLTCTGTCAQKIIFFLLPFGQREVWFVLSHVGDARPRMSWLCTLSALLCVMCQTAPQCGGAMRTGPWTRMLSEISIHSFGPGVLEHCVLPITALLRFCFCFSR